jgi:hypothetical protein
MLDRVLTDTSPGAVVLYMGASGEIPALVTRLLPVLERLAARHRGQLVVLCALTGREHRRALQAAGYLMVEDPHRAIAACAALAAHAERVHAAAAMPEPGDDDDLPRIAWQDAPNEAQAKAWLAQAGIAVPPSRVARSPAEAVAAARSLGYPVAMKILSAAVAHKSDIGGVELGVADDAAAMAAFDRLHAQASLHEVAALDGMLVEPMQSGGIEMIVGTRTDPAFGPVVSVGLGGIYVDTLRDVALRPAPLGVREAGALLKELAGYPILAGARGARFDIDALARAVSRVSALAWRFREEIEEIEINPFLLRAQGGVALDALVVPRRGKPCSIDERGSEKPQ